MYAEYERETSREGRRPAFDQLLLSQQGTRHTPVQEPHILADTQLFTFQRGRIGYPAIGSAPNCLSRQFNRPGLSRYDIHCRLETECRKPSLAGQDFIPPDASVKQP